MRRLLVANRGEIALRVMRAARAMGLEVVAVYSEADRQAPHVEAADEAVLIGPAPATQSYANIEAVLRAARASGADAVHPGYGFLAENAEFARAVQAAGLIWVGPDPDTIALLGDKIAARQLARAAGVPVLPGTDEPVEGADALAHAERLGFPLLVKAAGGGGGIGIQKVTGPQELAQAIESASRKARSFFGSGGVYLERYLERARHVEIQVLADRHGRVIHLGERECSIQRRHQKVVEESPSVAVTPELREAMGRAAVAVARAAGYVNAGTVEFLLDPEGRFYFLEMNTRIQVEHPVTELVTGVDLVVEQLRIAQGLPLELDSRAPVGHAIEVRLYAEDPRTLLPSPGMVQDCRLPSGDGIRVEHALRPGIAVPPFYDPLLAKIVVRGGSRSEAIARLQAALEATEVNGIKTNLPLLREIAKHPAFVEGDLRTTFLREHFGIG